MSAGLTTSLTVADAQRTGREALSGNVDSPGLDADMILANLLGCDRTQLFARDDQRLSDQIAVLFQDGVRRRLRGIPVAYVTGWKEWYGLRLTVSPAVLIPRPETEGLADMAIARARAQPSCVVVDVGTGSGAIAIALARAIPDAEVIAVDISASALDIAAENVATYKLGHRIRLIEADLIEGLDRAPDVIVANLPYVPASLQDQLANEVLSEPHGALFADEEGTAAYRRLLQQLRDRNWTPVVMMEIDPDQVDRLTQMAAQLYPTASLSVKQDLSGVDRFIILEPAS
jgi:release factor glutamine methyltransferase